MNLDELENQLINGGLIEKPSDPQDKFHEQLQAMAQQFGISFGDKKTAGGSRAGSAPSAPSAPSTPYSRDIPGVTSAYAGTPSVDMSAYAGAPSRSATPNSGGPSGSASTPYANAQSRQYASDQQYDNDDDDDADTDDEITPFTRVGSDLDSKTREQERRQHINSVMRDISTNSESFNFEREKREDEKCMMLEEIDSLIYSLQDAEVDLSRIPKVDTGSSYEEIDMVRKMLRHKNDRVRYCNLAEEFLLWGAYGMEELFDGKRVWFGKYKPCLTGWNKQVQCKLRRMRMDTSQLVSDVMHDYNIGPGLRVLLELVPNMFIYSNDKRRDSESAALYTEDDITAAKERLRNM